VTVSSGKFSILALADFGFCISILLSHITFTMKYSYILYVILFTFAGCAGNPENKSGNGAADTTKATIALNDAEKAAVAAIDCPPEGNAKSARVQALNLLKNRAVFPAASDFDEAISLDAVLAPGDDTERWLTSAAGKVTGYVREVKPGGSESTNCQSKDRDLRDTHIELVKDPMNNNGNACMVVEVTPRMRAIMRVRGIDWSTSMLRSKFLGRWVTVEGWMLFDSEHSNMAENTRPGNARNWRGTAWEIHPVTGMQVAEKH
jgi:hypothetical protein